MRKSLIAGLLGVALLATPAAFSTKSDAASPIRQNAPASSPRNNPAPLPNFDIRLAGRGEFASSELSSTGGRQRAAGSGNAALAARAAAVENFRAGLGSRARHLRAEANETGAMKNFFVEGEALSGPQADLPDNIARGFLRDRAPLFALTAAGVNGLKLNKEDKDDGTSFLEYSQTVGGVKVFEGEVKVAVGRGGEVLSVREGFLVDGQGVSLKPALSEAEGIARAFAHAGRNVNASFAETRGRGSKSESAAFANPLSPAYEDVLSELNVVRVGDSARLAWHVYAEVGPEEWYEMLVDAHTGELLLRHNLYVFEAQGTVYTEAPDKGARQLVSFVGDTTINTAAGWMGTSTVTTGNNVEAYLDRNADNAPDATNSSTLSNGHALSSTQNFTFTFDTTVAPTTATNQAAVVTNLFYYNNVMHDFSYNLGFTETARNFQVNNFGRGGTGNDSVRAEAQDGSGTNNANFATPPDGQRPRMQQYIFTAPAPDRDSSVDGDVVFHEYGHGISNRLIGNGSTALSGTQSGAMGEGWSDYWANTINGDGAVGEYVTADPAGIRRAAYTVPAAAVHDSYADVCAGGCAVHNDGEVWAATLWDLRTQLGAAVTDRLVLNGMKFTPTRPSFLNARDGILQADQNLNGGANRCTIWTVFARHGMGVSAIGNDGTTHVAASDLPTDCGGTCTYSISPTSASQPAAGGTGTVSVTAGAGCNWTAASNASFITVTGGASGTGSGTVSYSVAANTGTTSRTGTLTVAGLTFTVTQAGTSGGGTELILNPGFESGTTPWAYSGVTFSNGAYPHSGVYYAIVGNGANSTTGTLYQTVTIPSGGANLNFWLNVSTSEAVGDPVYDRLFIEVRNTSGTLLTTLATFSNQNGGTAGAYVLRGPYNLGSFAGQTVRIQFRGTNDSTLPTSFRVDDVSVK
ncbi:MAG TPA: M36 family metallopeptidase [Pyrinomonadaceae bacterium]|jgi:Zn-dependent metalloprotease|nr:M36 family metallopeptidase [Pyrinomonadaceae bacterium]